MAGAKTGTKAQVKTMAKAAVKPKAKVTVTAKPKVKGGRPRAAAQSARGRAGSAKKIPAGESAVRGRLIAAAVELFAAKGYAATSVREIVARARVTQPVLYYHFGSKEKIFLEMMKRPFEVYSSLVDECVSGHGTAITRLLRMAEKTFRLYIGNLGVARVMHSVYYGPPQGAPFVDFDSLHFKFQEAVARLLREAVKNGEVRRMNVEDGMWVVIGAVNIAMETQLCHPEIALDAHGLLRVLHLIFAGMAPAHAAGGRKR